MTLFSMPFLAGLVGGLFMFSQATSVPAAALFLLLIMAGVVFERLLKAPTLHGRKIMDRIEGFRT